MPFFRILVGLFALLINFPLLVSMPHAQSFQAEPESYSFKNVLIDEKLHDIFRHIPRNSNVKLSSPGGWPIGMNIGSIIDHNNIIIEISDFCISGCAEYLLPAGKQIRFTGNPIIAVHGNPKIWREVALIHKPEVNDLCPNTVFEAYEKFADEFNINNNFWTDQIDTLGIEKVSFSILPSGCPKISIKYTNEYWLLSSNQIKYYFDVETTGKVCADDLKYCSKVVSQRWKAGTAVIIGDTKFISVGWLKSWFL